MRNSQYDWPGFRKDVWQRAAVCLACQHAKVHRHTKAPLEPFVIPERRFDLGFFFKTKRGVGEEEEEGKNDAGIRKCLNESS